MTEALLTLEKVSKSFGFVNVIDQVSVFVYPGKVTVLFGENGAGKFTLIKMMSGVYQPDFGTIIVDGQPTTLPTTKAAEVLGIATIHQELNLVPTMSVAENVMLGRTPEKFGLVNYRELRRRAQAAFDIIGVNVDLDILVGELGIARQQLVEIAKALFMDARMLILDEPTAALTGHEIDQLFSVVDDLKAKGVGRWTAFLRSSTTAPTTFSLASLCRLFSSTASFSTPACLLLFPIFVRESMLLLFIFWSVVIIILVIFLGL